MDNNVQLTMIVAKNLINKKKYHEARVLLGTIDHPKAREWIKKLDQITLGSNSSPIAPKTHTSLSQTNNNRSKKEPSKPPTSTRGCFSIIGAIFLFVVINSLFTNQAISPRQTSNTYQGGGSKAEQILNRIFPSQSIEVFTDSDYVVVTLPVSESPFPGSVANTQLNQSLVEAICTMKNSGYSQHIFQFDVIYGTVRTGFGTNIPDIVLIISVSANAAKRLNCLNPEDNNLASIAYEYIWSPG